MLLLLLLLHDTAEEAPSFSPIHKLPLTHPYPLALLPPPAPAAAAQPFSHRPLPPSLPPDLSKPIDVYCEWIDECERISGEQEKVGGDEGEEEDRIGGREGGRGRQGGV